MSGRTLVVGDVHGCAEELRQLVSLASPDRVLLLGDLFTKGPEAAGVWEQIRAGGFLAILGNHDDFLLQRPERAQELGLGAEVLDWLGALPLVHAGTRPDGQPWIAVHAGLDPVGRLPGTTRAQRLTMRRWPDDQGQIHPFWWERWQGPELVVYGHDAVRGLVDRRPRTLGLDSGCVYGGRLSGWLVEEDRLLSVPARRAWRAVEPRGGPG